MPTELPADAQRVLIIDRSADARDVFTTVLERRGVATRSAAGFAAAMDEMRDFRPQVVVLDVDSASTDPHDFRHQCRSAEASEGVTWVMIGSLPSAPGPDDYLVHKPYRYGPLLRKIEQLTRAATHPAT